MCNDIARKHLGVGQKTISFFWTDEEECARTTYVYYYLSSGCMVDSQNLNHSWLCAHIRPDPSEFNYTTNGEGWCLLHLTSFQRRSCFLCVCDIDLTRTKIMPNLLIQNYLRHIPVGHETMIQPGRRNISTHRLPMTKRNTFCIQNNCLRVAGGFENMMMEQSSCNYTKDAGWLAMDSCNLRYDVRFVLPQKIG